MTLQTELNQKQAMYVTPRVNIIEEKDLVRVEAELPGVPKDGVDLEVNGNELTLTGHRKSQTAEGMPLIRERRAYDFRRVFALSRAVDATNIKADMSDGVLTLRIPKAEHMKPRKIAVH